MLLKDYIIDRPEKTKIQRQKGVAYVYYVTDSVYDKQKQRYDETRVLIGKMMNDTQMIPNEKYATLFPDAIYGEAQSSAFSDTLCIGSYMVIEKVLKESQLNQLLDSVYEDKAKLLKDVIAYMVIQETSVFQHFPSFIENYPAFEGKVRSDSTICSTLKKISNRQIDLFNEAWANIHSKVKDMYINYDSTNMNTSSTGIELAAYGKAKDDEELPQINVSYAINQKDATPLFYELYEGSIIDNSQCKHMIETSKRYNFKNIGFILDRGYFSKSNIQYFEANGYDYLMMVKTNNESIQKVIQSVGGSLKTSIRHYITAHNVYGCTVNETLYSNEEKQKHIHVYYDNVRAANEQNIYLDLFNKLEEELKGKVKAKIVVKKDLTRFEKKFKLKFDDNGYLLSYQRNDRYIQEQVEKLGYFVIVTSKEMSAEEAIDIYRNRDAVEKMFRSIKTDLASSTFGVHSDESLVSKMQLIFIASIIRNEIFQKLKPIREKEKDKKNYTVNASLHILDNIRVTKYNRKTYSRGYALTSKQKKVLTAFGIDEKYVNEWVKEISI